MYGSSWANGMSTLFTYCYTLIHFLSCSIRHADLLWPPPKHLCTHDHNNSFFHYTITNSRTYNDTYHARVHVWTDLEPDLLPDEPDLEPDLLPDLEPDR